MTIGTPYTVMKSVVNWKAKMLRTLPHVTSEKKEIIIDESLFFLLPFGLLLYISLVFWGFFS